MIVLHGESRGHFERLCSQKKNVGSGGEHAVRASRRHENLWFEKLTAMTQSSSWENLKELALVFRIPVVKLRGDVNEIAVTLKQRCPDLSMSTCKKNTEMLQWYFGCHYPLFSAVRQKQKHKFKRTCFCHAQPKNLCREST